MKLISLPDYFIVKVNIKEQKQRREKIGNILLHFQEVQMQRNLQHGEITDIGTNVSKILPQACIGDILIFHHFVEGDGGSGSGFIYSDDDYNYYNVTASDFNGRRNETYAVVHDGKIIPHKDFIFIKPDEKKNTEPEENIQKVGNLFLFKEWEESREEKEEKAKTIMEEIKNMSKGKNIKDDIKRGLEEKQGEAEKITSSLNKKRYLPYKVIAANPSLTIRNNIYALNIAAATKVEYKDTSYTVIPYKYCVATS